MCYEQEKRVQQLLRLFFYLRMRNVPQTRVSPAVSTTRWLPFLGKPQVFVHGEPSLEQGRPKGNDLDERIKSSEASKLKTQTALALVPWKAARLRVESMRTERFLVKMQTQTASSRVKDIVWA